jgi:hypothetical protein
MILVYRGDSIFAALPGTRMLHTEDAIMLKFNRQGPALERRIEADPRFGPSTLDPNSKPGSEGSKWRLFALHEDADLHDALEWLAEAHKCARPEKKPR